MSRSIAATLLIVGSSAVSVNQLGTNPDFGTSAAADDTQCFSSQTWIAGKGCQWPWEANTDYGTSRAADESQCYSTQTWAAGKGCQWSW